jgi:hypothetical protein
MERRKSLINVFSICTNNNDAKSLSKIAFNSGMIEPKLKISKKLFNNNKINRIGIFDSRLWGIMP